MRLNIRTKNNYSYYTIIKDYTNLNGTRTTTIFEKLGNQQQVEERFGKVNTIENIKKYIEELNNENKEEIINVQFNPNKTIERNVKKRFNIGYLFLKKIYNELKTKDICKEIENKYQFKFDLNEILSYLVFARVIYPCSKLETYKQCQNFIEQPKFKLHDEYRALSYMADNIDFIQEKIFENSKNVIKRNSEIIYYDCTNYFFEIELDDEFRKYGINKQHQPKPQGGMGLFMDGDGFPLAFNVNSGNTNEQTTLKPLEKQIIKDFELSKFIVCTDAGLASNENRKFNNIQNRSYIVTQSLKKIKGHLKDWALSPEDWHTINSNKKINLNDVDKSGDNEEIYYKERWINENGLEQRLIVSYSPKYAEYQRSIRNRQVERAQNLINNPTKISKNRQDDPKRFIKSASVTNDGEIASKKVFSLNTTAIEKEEDFDGFYAVCTTLEDDISEIIKINKRR